MMQQYHSPSTYPVIMRISHWIRAGLIIGLIALGWWMTSLPDGNSIKFERLFPLHKSFGMLVLFFSIFQLFVRYYSTLPESPENLALWEKRLSNLVQRAMIALTLIVPIMGYVMSSTYLQSDGVPFFIFDIPEILPKNENAFVLFNLLHKISAYTLMVLVILHICGVIKHRLFDRTKENDVLSRML
ncbi:cytochrome b [Acetobacter okinawensis]|uniref:cytochrome b n=1 Tax=Acetobacter okinawensis TaxID=1076594 RepID=UPI0004727145|nr:cytochrome b/b6 domain-containing protein [Acetobacter okinawensis]